MVDGLRFEVDGEVGRLSFTRPEKMNAITYGMWSEITEVVAAVERDPAVKVLVLTGQGPHFSAGADIGEFRAIRSDAERAARYDKAVEDAVGALTALRKPTIAMIEGNCIGGGCQLSVACDFRFAAEGSRFGITPSKLGIVYHFPSTRQLVDLVGPAHARYFLLSGLLVDAARAREIGLVNEVFAAGALESAVAEFAATLCARSQVSVRGMNRIIEKILDGTVEPDAEVEDLRAGSLHSADYAEGVAAFLERRTPRFTQR